MPNPDASSPADPQVLTRFQEELARAAAMPGLAAAGPALWPRFAGYYQGLARLPRKAAACPATPVAPLARGHRAPLRPRPGAGLGGDHQRGWPAAPSSMPSPPPTATRRQAGVRRGAARTGSSYRYPFLRHCRH